jgi:hypothetical protein
MLLGWSSGLFRAISDGMIVSNVAAWMLVRAYKSRIANTHFRLSEPRDSSLWNPVFETLLLADRPQMTVRGTCALLGGWRSLQTDTHNIWYLLLFHGNNGYANAPLLCCTYIACLVVTCGHQGNLHVAKEDPVRIFDHILRPEEWILTPHIHTHS